MGKSEGFAGQRLRVLARPLVSQSLGRPGTSRLTVTDCGMFPRAAGHERRRQQAVPEAIVLVCTEGDGWYQAGEERHRVEPGQVVVIPPGVPHAYGAGGSNPWTIWWIHVIGEDVHELLRSAGLDSPRPPVWVDDLFRLTALIDEALGHLEHDDTAAAMVGASGAAWHLLALLTASPRPSGGRTDPVRQVIGFLQSNLASHVPVTELAAMANLSPSHFAARFRLATGLGVLQYQTSLRMTRARVLLDTTDDDIGVIARAVGYRDPFYFSRQFRAVHGTSPTDYRAAAKG